MFEEPGSKPSTSNAGETASESSNLKKYVFALTAIFFVVVAIRVYFVYKVRHDENTAVADEGPSHHLIKDDYIVPRKLYANTMDDAKALDGKRIWVFAGSQMDYYPATNTHAIYPKSAGLLLGAEPLDVVNFIKQAAPASLYTRIPRGDHQVLMLFHKPGEPAKLYGVAVGTHESNGYTFYLDEAFFYDDPHTLYAHWPANIWQAIDAHKAVVGMNELQAQLALGQVSRPGAGTVNNRTVTFDNNGHPVTMVFDHGKATSVQ